jgi:hypothetical protein
VSRFRHQLWAHNLGVAESSVARWREKDFFAIWDMIAEYNRDHLKTPDKMFGDGVVPFDALSDPGRKGKIRLFGPLAITPRHVWF